MWSQPLTVEKGKPQTGRKELLRAVDPASSPELPARESLLELRAQVEGAPPESAKGSSAGRAGMGGKTCFLELHSGS